jgi:hypothetical protein
LVWRQPQTRRQCNRCGLDGNANAPDARSVRTRWKYLWPALRVQATLTTDIESAPPPDFAGQNLPKRYLKSCGQDRDRWRRGSRWRTFASFGLPRATSQPPVALRLRTCHKCRKTHRKCRIASLRRSPSRTGIGTPVILTPDPLADVRAIFRPQIQDRGRSSAPFRSGAEAAAAV